MDMVDVISFYKKSNLYLFLAFSPNEVWLDDSLCISEECCDI